MKEKDKTIKEYKDSLEKKIESESIVEMKPIQRDCPHCGRCPVCGRRTEPYNPYPIYPWYPQPWYPYYDSQPIYISGTSGECDCNPEIKIT